jgi:hypothetical protein
MNRTLLISKVSNLILAAIFFIGLNTSSPKAYAAFVPVSEKKAAQKEVSPENIQDVQYRLAQMSNKEIENLTGKKLTLKEKLGLFLLRKQTKKESYGKIKLPDNWVDDCFTMYLKNGDVLEVKIIQIGTTEIKYQRCNKPGDPEILIAKSDVFNIKDSGGDVIFSSRDESWKRSQGSRSGGTESLALAAGITGIGSLTLGLLVWPIGLAAGIAAGIMGIVSMRRLNRNRNIRGEGWAITGITAGGLWLFIGLLVLIIVASI